MTRKDYIRIADALKSVPDNISRDAALEAVVGELNKESNFDEQKFRDHIAKEDS
jgi:hypothetical protein